MGNLKVIWGSDHKVGTTMVAQSITEVTAEKNEDVLLLSVCANPGDDFYDEDGGNIEELKSRLSCQLITKENIRDFALKGKSFYKINGFSDLRSMYEFTPEMAMDLLEVAAEAFSEVIVDSGTGLDNPLTLAALTYGRDNIFVFSQQESSLRSWQRLADQMAELGAVPRIAAINKYFKGDNFTPGYIAQRTGLPQNIFRTVSESEFGIQAEVDRKTLLFYGDKQFEKDIKSL